MRYLANPKIAIAGYRSWAQWVIGAWWIDGVGSLAIVWFLVEEGREAWSGDDPFASYFDSFRGIVLHFEHFVCDGDRTYCTASGCLHQVYVSAGRHCRLMRSYYAPAGE